MVAAAIGEPIPTEEEEAAAVDSIIWAEVPKEVNVELEVVLIFFYVPFVALYGAI